MRIAILTDGIWPFVVGGMQKHSYYLCKYLLANGVDVDLYYTNRDFSPTESLQSLFDSCGTGQLRAFHISYIKSFYFPGHYLWELYGYSKRLARELRKNIGSCDFIYAQGLAGWYTIVHKFKIIGNTPILSNFHGLNMFQHVVDRYGKLQQLMFKPVVRRIILRADYVQSLGGELTQLLKTQGVKVTRIVEFGIAVDENWVTPLVSDQKPKRRAFVFIGRSERIKGAQELRFALLRLLSRYDFTFDFVGPIADREKVVHENVQYHGTIRSESTLKKVLDKADFLVLPSYSEGMPTVILEAMARGCSVIATNVGAVSQQVSTSNGFLIAPQRSDLLYEAIETAITMKAEQLLEMKLCAVQTVKNEFLWNRLITDMITFFSSTSRNATKSF